MKRRKILNIGDRFYAVRQACGWNDYTEHFSLIDTIVETIFIDKDNVYYNVEIEDGQGGCKGSDVFTDKRMAQAQLRKDEYEYRNSPIKVLTETVTPLEDGAVKTETKEMWYASQYEKDLKDNERRGWKRQGKVTIGS